MTGRVKGGFVTDPATTASAGGCCGEPVTTTAKATTSSCCGEPVTTATPVEIETAATAAAGCCGEPTSSAATPATASASKPSGCCN